MGSPLLQLRLPRFCYHCLLQGCCAASQQCPTAMHCRDGLRGCPMATHRRDAPQGCTAASPFPKHGAAAFPREAIPSPTLVPSRFPKPHQQTVAGVGKELSFPTARLPERDKSVSLGLRTQRHSSCSGLASGRVRLGTQRKKPTQLKRVMRDLLGTLFLQRALTHRSPTKPTPVA